MMVARKIMSCSYRACGSISIWQGTRLGPNALIVKGILELDIPSRPMSLFELQAE